MENFNVIQRYGRNEYKRNGKKTFSNTSAKSKYESIGNDKTNITVK